MLVLVLEAIIATVVLLGASLGVIALPAEIGALYCTYLQVILGVNSMLMDNMEVTMMKRNMMESGTHGAVRVFLGSQVSFQVSC